MSSLYSFALLALIAGICAVALLPALPPASVLLALLPCGAALTLAGACAGPRWRWACTLAGLALLGFAYASLRAHVRLADRLSTADEGRVIFAEGYISGLPHSDRYGRSFVFVTATPDLPRRIAVHWYGEHPEVIAASRWRLALKLKRPHGQQNPGGFDQEAWMLQQGLGASATVRMGTRLPGLAWQARGDQLRAQIAARIQRVLPGSPYAGVIVAEAVGDRRGVEPDLWERFAAAGTSHLLVISGLHIAMVAGLVSALTGWVLRSIPAITQRVRLPAWRLSCGWVAALGYSALAGLSVPTQRAVLMLSIAVLCLLSGRRWAAGTIWLLTLSVVLLFDPLAAGTAGLWLSFLAVGGLLWLGGNRMAPLKGWRNLGRTEIAATLATLPALLYLFGRLPLASPLANALAVPLVSLLVVPLTLLGLLDPTGYALRAAERVFAFTDWLITQTIAWLPAPWLTPPPGWTLLPAALGILLALAPRGAPGRPLALFMLLPMFTLQPPPVTAGEFRATVIDVGQGLAVLVQTREHTLLFDTGRPGQAQRTILPLLRRYGIAALDTLVVSHADSDHAGGVAALLKTVPVSEIVGSLAPDVPALQQRAQQACQAGQRWDWDGVQFSMLWPPPDTVAADDNAGSCVLQVSTAHTRILIPADIGKAQEAELIQQHALPRYDVVVAGHHGSRTSSSQDFVHATQPQWVIYSAGYLNRFNHPHPEIEQRYAAAGSKALRTDLDGAIIIDSGQPMRIHGWRDWRPHYWFTR
ncbi:DNA internalization-related competence protein ComEC/Rec2 [Amantichitinum ursilacus]|uniref:ComEC family competence protein n=1 Tax=Amantichitinum ursilacus TaxID=857265 RepID=A0A0N0GP30_9NEIS|nr:DNA internalization-related competence protein ComEC/Rec2 [Amantichitinum ursilacus]KPC53093.1 ComEC family competence protein [Amantichitinum ursilacus]